jgi:hypothetical protein
MMLRFYAMLLPGAQPLVVLIHDRMFPFHHVLFTRGFRAYVFDIRARPFGHQGIRFSVAQALSVTSKSFNDDLWFGTASKQGIAPRSAPLFAAPVQLRTCGFRGLSRLAP